jgi:hypothetical protein
MIQVLLNLFPWLNPKLETDFRMTNDRLSFRFFFLYPTGTKDGAIQIHGRLKNWCISHWNNGEIGEFHSFSPGDKSEAVGLISYLLPEWKKLESFNKSVFRMYQDTSTTNSITINGDVLLMSPSGFAAQIAKNGTEPFSPWKPITQEVSIGKSYNFLMEVPMEVPRNTVAGMLENPLIIPW